MLTKCPSEFVIPTNKYDSRIQWVGDTGCAFACKLPIWSESEYRSYESVTLYLPILSLPFVFVLLLTWIFNKEKRKQYLVICLAVSVGCSAFLSTFAYNIPWYKRNCRSNAVPLDASDGFSFCALQGLSYVYIGLTTSVCWMNQSIDLYLKVGIGMRSTDQYKAYYISSIFLLPLIPLIYVLATKNYGYSPGNPVCWIIYSKELDVYVWYIPIAVMTLVGLFCMTVVRYKIILSVIKTSSSKKGGSNDMIAAVRTPILFVLTFLAFFISLVAYRAEIYVNTKSLTSEMAHWTECVFSNFDGVSDESYTSICGSYVKTKMSFATAMWAFICVTGQAAMVSLVYLSNPSVFKIWWEWCRSFTSRLSPSRSPRKIYVVGASSTKVFPLQSNT